MTQPSPADTAPHFPDRRRKILLYGGLGLVAALAIVGFAGWYFLIRDDSPPSVTSAAQEAARDAAIEEATSGENAGAVDESDPLPTADRDDPADAAAPGLDGTWIIDDSIGDFADFSSGFVGFRIDEELASIGASTVVGRTPDVTGTLEIEGATITSTEMLVDMTTLTTGISNRDGAIRRQAIETNTFPEATFSLTSPIELGTLPDDGVPVDITATGDLTVHGVTNSVDIPLTAELNSGVIVVAGELGPFLLSDFDIQRPSAAVVLSVEDNAIMELQLFFTQG
ncbi:MAG: YceI family protein [Acidimicrobiia bacterium]|nr:YceI family protein [Acidimicrobiia bacterium]